MKYIKLEEIIHFSVGKNMTQQKECEIKEKYTQEDFEEDLYCSSRSKEIQGCIINLMKTEAAPLLKDENEKCITSNFLIGKFDIKVLDPWYFLYQFNMSKGVEQQKKMYNQGTTLSVKKIPMKNIKELVIPMPNIDKQKLIGKIYQESIIRRKLMIEQAENMTNLMMAVIDKIEED